MSLEDPGATREDGRRRRPVIMAVDDETAVLAAVARDLRRGFGERYQVLRARSGEEALRTLGDARARGLPVALLVADQRMPGMPGTDLSRGGAPSSRPRPSACC
jgi:thioredoxin reductase (NADPH)